MDHRPKCERLTSKTSRRKHKKNISMFLVDNNFLNRTHHEAPTLMYVH